MASRGTERWGHWRVVAGVGPIGGEFASFRPAPPRFLAVLFTVRVYVRFAVCFVFAVRVAGALRCVLLFVSLFASLFASLFVLLVASIFASRFDL